VRTILVLLRPEADGPALTEILERLLPDGRRYLQFEYHVIRAWEKPVEEILAGGLGTLPMAPVADVAPAMLPGVIRRLEERIEQEAPRERAGVLWTAIYMLMGLRYSEEFAEALLQGVRATKDSVTYQAIIREGRVAEAQAILLRIGSKRFGPPSDATRLAIEAITSIDRLELLLDRPLDVESWEELLAE
jgi:hypothetical protein